MNKAMSAHRVPSPPDIAASHWECPAAPRGSSPASHRRAHTCGTIKWSGEACADEVCAADPMLAKSHVQPNLARQGSITGGS